VLNTTQLGLPAPSGPVWSPDGTKIRFRIAEFNTNPNRVYQVHADGSSLALLWLSTASDIDWSIRNEVTYRRDPSVGDTNQNVLVWRGSLMAEEIEVNLPGQTDYATPRQAGMDARRGHDRLPGQLPPGDRHVLEPLGVVQDPTGRDRN
jgi:hypothetical protein